MAKVGSWPSMACLYCLPTGRRKELAENAWFSTLLHIFSDFLNFLTQASLGGRCLLRLGFGKASQNELLPNSIITSERLCEALQDLFTHRIRNKTIMGTKSRYSLIGISLFALISLGCSNPQESAKDAETRSQDSKWITDYRQSVQKMRDTIKHRNEMLRLADMFQGNERIERRLEAQKIGFGMELELIQKAAQKRAQDAETLGIPLETFCRMTAEEILIAGKEKNISPAVLEGITSRKAEVYSGM